MDDLGGEPRQLRRWLVNRLGAELTGVLCLAMVCATVLVALGKLPAEFVSPIFSAVTAGGFALAMPNKEQPK